MKINTKIINNLSPCNDRFNNYLEHYEEFDGTLEDFLSLGNITYNDKTWVFQNLAAKTQLLKWSYLCAESVLYIFEASYPNDKRPRLALNAKLKYINSPTKANLINWNNSRKDAAAAAAATAIYAAAAAAAATAAPYAATYATAATYTAAAAAAAAAAATATATATATYIAAAREAQEDLNLLFMVESNNNNGGGAK